MNFKHEKFDDSAVMRSLEKVAREKGWVESKPITKSASSELNFSPSSNLTENVLKLCAGLKQVGLERYALDIENKFVTFKQAATLYDTHGETGEDLVEAAHPKGSHKLEDMDSNHVVLTILDQHLKGVELANKKPTGKLSNARDILRAVKIALAEGTPVQVAPGQVVNVPLSPNLIENIFSFTRKLSEMFSSMQFFDWERESILGFNRLNDFINKTASSKVISMDSVNRIITLANSFKNSLDKETVLGMQSTAAKNAAFYVNSLINFMEDTVKEEIKSLSEKSIKSDEQAKVSPILDKIKAAQKDLIGITMRIEAHKKTANPNALKEVQQWVRETAAALAKLEKDSADAPLADSEATLREITEDFIAVRKDWA